MQYEFSIDGRNDERTSLNASARDIRTARDTALRLAKELKRDVMIERVTAKGISTVIDRVSA